MLCLKCGCPNDDQTFYCARCGKRLLDIATYNQMTAPIAIDSRLKYVMKLCEDVQKEAISVEEYGEKILGYHTSMTADVAYIREAAKEDDYEAYSPEEMEIGYRGIGLWIAGLEELYSYLEILDTDLIKSGLKKIKEGNECINKAIYYNELKRDTEGTSGKI